MGFHMLRMRSTSAVCLYRCVSLVKKHSLIGHLSASIDLWIDSNGHMLLMQSGGPTVSITFVRRTATPGGGNNQTIYNGIAFDGLFIVIFKVSISNLYYNHRVSGLTFEPESKVGINISRI